MAHLPGSTGAARDRLVVRRQVLQAVLQVATWRVDMASVYQLTTEEADVARRLGDPWEVAFALAELALGQNWTSRADDAAASIEESVRGAARLRNPTLVTYSGLVFGIVARHRHPDRGFGLSRRASTRHSPSGTTRQGQKAAVCRPHCYASAVNGCPPRTP